ncbi:MAG: endonuclease/exonuclease/phosphatase family protein [Pyrinomonadaceae bacterium]
MRLISWNINFRSDCAQHIYALKKREPDIVVLQEVNPNTLSQLRTGLRGIELTCVKDNKDIAVQFGRVHYFALIASRWPLTVLSNDAFRVPFPESVFAAVVSNPTTDFELHTTHIPPGSSHGWVKIETFEGIYNRLTSFASRPRILCGDFNSPRQEKFDGRIVTWGQTEKSNVLRKGRERWDAGERCVIEGLRDFDLIDVFRFLHGYEVQEYSIVMKHKDKITRRRFDHVFASSLLNATACHYLHELRERGLSNHSPIEVDFAPKSNKSSNGPMP